MSLSTTKSCAECGGTYYCSGRCKAHYNAWYRSQHPEYFHKKYKERRATTRDADNAKTRQRLNSTYLERQYGITEGDLAALGEKQNHKCKICGKSESGRIGRGRLYVDHDHKTGAVRGLLCHQCNAGLGMFKDCVESLAAAINYLGRAQ